MLDDKDDLIKVAMSAIAEYEAATGYTVIIEQEPDGAVTWTDILPTGECVTTLIPADTTE